MAGIRCPRVGQSGNQSAFQYERKRASGEIPRSARFLHELQKQGFPRPKNSVENPVGRVRRNNRKDEGESPRNRGFFAPAHTRHDNPQSCVSGGNLPSEENRTEARPEAADVRGTSFQNLSGKEDCSESTGRRLRIRGTEIFRAFGNSKGCNGNELERIQILQFMKNGKILRCAVYTRKSVSEGLEKDFNTLVAQREAGENYIRSQKHEGWIAVDKHYDDGGFSGGNMERPALRELFDDIENGRIDIVVVYKVDRLSRSLMDFAKIIELFEKHDVSFVSVTQHFNTKDSMGRLTLNILLSFAQFERELISERTRDKMSAARRKGKWVGGVPILGYDISPDGSGLVVNRAEAESVRTIFDTYLDTRSALRTLEILEEKNIRMKSWRTVGGKMHVGKAFTKSTLYYLLKNTAYIGKIRYKGEIYPAEHEAIIDAEVFEKTAERMSSNFRERTTAKVRTKTEGLLSGILYCGHCNRPMTNKYTRKGGSKTYRYYVCQNAVQRGWKSCPYPSLPAAAIEEFVVGEISGISTDEKLSAEVVGNFTKNVRAELADSVARENALEKALSEIRVRLADCTDRPKTEDLLREEIRHSEALEICRKRTEILGENVRSRKRS